MTNSLVLAILLSVLVAGCAQTGRSITMSDMEKLARDLQTIESEAPPGTARGLVSK
jgi:outer membrane lipoprotein-sorting protein